MIIFNSGSGKWATPWNELRRIRRDIPIYDFLSVVNVYIVEESWMGKEFFFSPFEYAKNTW